MLVWCIGFEGPNKKLTLLCWSKEDRQWCRLKKVIVNEIQIIQLNISYCGHPYPIMCPAICVPNSWFGLFPPVRSKYIKWTHFYFISGELSHFLSLIVPPSRNHSHLWKIHMRTIFIRHICTFCLEWQKISFFVTKTIENIGKRV